MKREYFGMLARLLGYCMVCFALAVNSCYNDSGEVDVAEEGDEAAMFSTTTTPESLVSNATTTNVTGLTNVPVSQWITVSFDKDINPATLTSSSFKVVLASTGEAIPGTISYANRVATFKPTFKFNFTGSAIAYTGLRQNTQYKVMLDAASIKDTSGQPVTLSASTFTFTTADIDYGIYFLGSDGEFEKFVSGRTNRFYDPSKPTIVYIHGWQSGSSQNNYGRENPYFFYSSGTGFVNSAQTWRDRGYNIAIVYWAQWADEGEVKDAQAKLWMADNNRKDMRYRLADGSYRQYSTAKTVTQLIYENYLQVFANYTGGNIRLVGHSLGNQLATTLAKMISDNVQSGAIPSSYLPKRVVFLDPFWGKNAEACVGNQWVGAVCRTYVRTLIQRHAMAFEQYKSTALGGVVGDENLDMRKMTAFFRIWPDFIGINDQTAQHLYCYVWYMLSGGGLVYGNNEAQGGVGAAATDAQVKALMNWNFATGAVRSTVRMWYTDGSGCDTWQTNDDYFSYQTGVNTW